MKKIRRGSFYNWMCDYWLVPIEFYDEHRKDLFCVNPFHIVDGMVVVKERQGRKGIIKKMR